MSTHDDRHFIDKLIAAGGQLYDDEPGAIKIVEYIHAWGRVTWGVVWEGDDPDKYRPTQYVMNPRTIWERK